MSNPIEVLYQEHVIIKKAIESVKELKELIDINPDEYKEEMKRYISFFRKYADGFHHYKEEQILFPEMSKKNEFLAEGVIKEMFDNHSDFREILGNIESSVDAGEYKNAHNEFEKYAEALLDHIAVEDDEVFQMAESIFDDSEIEKIYFRFMDCDKDLGTSDKQKMEAMVN